MKDARAVVIAAVDLDGDGVGELDGRSVRVPFTLPGERVEIRLRAEDGGGWIGDLVRVLSPSPHRVAPRCRHFGPCGGCAWQHIAYPEQLRLKTRLLQSVLDQTLKRHAPEVAATRATPAREPDGTGAAPWGYRDKVHFVFGPGGDGKPLVMGHYRRGSRTVLPVDECPVHAEAGNRAAFLLREVLERAGVAGSTADGTTGVARHAVVRVTQCGGYWRPWS